MTTPRRASPTIRVASADQLATLEPVVLEAFGRRDRAPGWWSRKLHREVVDPALSMIACDPDGDVIGFVLVGAPPSQPGVGRLVSTGVVPRCRRAGLGRRLLEAAAEAATLAGLDRLVALAEADRASYYAGAEFFPEQTLTTLIASAPRAGVVPRAHRRERPAPWDINAGLSVGGWLAEAWERTPQKARTTIVFGGAAPSAWAHVSTEGNAQLIHRVVLAARPAAGLAQETCEIADALRASLTPRGPLLFYGLPSVSPITDTLRDAGWLNAQSCTRMVRRLRSAGVDRARPPAPS